MDAAGDEREAWGRVTAWLERNDPEVLTALGGPGSRSAIDEAEGRMGLKLPEEMRRWLLTNDVDAGRRPDGAPCPVAPGCEIPALPGGHLLLGLKGIERVYLGRMGLEEMQPSPDPDYPFWRREWVPIAAGVSSGRRTGPVSPPGPTRSIPARRTRRYACGHAPMAIW